jgi:Ca2+-binding EF-hand superfamily protein
LLIAAAVFLCAHSVGADDSDEPSAEPEDDSTAFTELDVNRDGLLTLEEFVKSRPRDEWRAAGALFHRSDINADVHLSLDEFRDKGTTRLRPDAVIERVERLLQEVELVAAAADSNQDGRLDAREWTDGMVARKAAELQELPFSQWDRDGDGTMTPQERRALVEIAFGIRRMDGQLLRKPAGIVVDWGYIRYLDKDHDDIVSREEFVERYFDGAKNAERFLERDADGDGRLTFAELAASGSFIDVYSVFCRFDADMDGRITGDEAMSRAEWWEQTAARQLPAFDLDGDGDLTVDEFELCTFGCPFADWYTSRNDANNDGRLSWTEYYVEQSPVLYGLARFFFGRFDRDGDGFLSRREFEFQVNLEKVPDEVVLAELDRNSDGRVTTRDLVDRDPRPPEFDRMGVLWWEERLMRQESALMAADDNHDGAVTPEEFSKHRAIVVAGILDKPLPRTPAASNVEAAIVSPATVSVAPYDRWKMAGLIAGNLVLLAGAAWIIRRRTA